MKKITLSFLCFICICFSCSSKTKSWEIKTLSKTEQERLFVLNKIYNYTHYFYPAEQLNLNNINAYEFLTYAVRETEKCDTDDSFLRTLYKLFSPICPDLIINDSIGTFTSSSHNADSTSFYVRCNQNVEGNSNIYAESNITKIDTVSRNYPTPDSLYTFIIDDKVKISFPVALTVMPQVTDGYTQLLKQCKNVKLPSAYSTPWWFKVLFKKGKIIVMNSYERRIANEIMRYGYIQYFYPYYIEDNLYETWDSVFYEHIGKVAACNNMDEYYDDVCKVMHFVKDLHINVNYTFWSSAGGNALVCFSKPCVYPEIETMIRNKELYVKNVGKTINPSIKVGDKIISVNNQDTEDFINDKLKKLSFSQEKAGFCKLIPSSIFECYVENQKKPDTTIVLKIQSNNLDTFSVAIMPELKGPFFIDSTFYKMVSDSICYVNLCGTVRDYESFRKIIPVVQKSNGIIFDMRGYPGDMIIGILANLIDSAITCGSIQRPVLYFPDQHKKQFVKGETWSIAPATSAQSVEFAQKYQYATPEKIRINKPVVFLMDANAISFAETILDMIKTYHIGTIIGEPSAGCNGDMVYCYLQFAPFVMSGYKFMNRDDSQHHGIGILPDIYVENDDFYTDKQLNTAINYIDKKVCSLTRDK